MGNGSKKPGKKAPESKKAPEPKKPAPVPPQGQQQTPPTGGAAPGQAPKR